MTTKDGEWFVGKPEKPGNYFWGGGVGDMPDLDLAQISLRIVYDTARNYCVGWWVRVGDLYEIPPIPRPRPEKIDTPVLVRNHECDNWKRRYLARWTDEGLIQVWNSGATSWSNGDRVMLSWNHWKLPEEE